MLEFIKMFIDYYRDKKNHEKLRVLNLECIVQECVNSMPKTKIEEKSLEEIAELDKAISYRNLNNENMLFKFGYEKLTKKGTASKGYVMILMTFYNKRVNIMNILERYCSPMEYELRLSLDAHGSKPTDRERNIDYIYQNEVFNNCADAIEKGIELADEYIKTRKISDASYN